MAATHVGEVALEMAALPPLPAGAEHKEQGV
jgi:hypothetical protein